MKFLKNSSIGIIYTFISIFTLTFLLTLLSYINFINNGWFIFFTIFNLVLSIFIGSFIVGRNSRQKGYLEGIKFGLILLIIISIMDFLGFNLKFNMKFVMFSIIILISSMLGGMIGIGFKKIT